MEAAGKGSVDDIRSSAIIVATSIFDNTSERKDPMRSTLVHSLRVLLVLSTLVISAHAQPRPKPKRVHAPVTVRGLVGGESNNTYVVHVRKGKQLTVQISWKKEEDNTASFSVTDSLDGGTISFGKESNGGRKWTGRVPKTGDYFIEVVAHPAAQYVLQVGAR